jgi:hypothetical protein
MTKRVPHRMRRIEVGTRSPSRRQSFRGCVGSFVPQQLRKNVRMRALRALALCRRNRLNASMRPTRLTNTRCGLAARITAMAPLPWAKSD